VKTNNLEDLEKFISILIVDNEEGVGKGYEEALKLVGYKNVKAVCTISEAYQYLEYTDILLIDYYLNNIEIGLKLVKDAKEIYGDNIQAIIYSGEGDQTKIDEIERNALSLRAAGFLTKPFSVNYLRLWIKELSKRIWMQQILDNSPDEIMIADNEGNILFANKMKKQIFESELIGEKCYNCFEIKLNRDRMCENCPGLKSYHGTIRLRTEWDYETKGNINRYRIHQRNQTSELVTAPIIDKHNTARAFIEIARDITIRKIVDEIISEMEKEVDLDKCKKIFIDGFKKLEISRVRLYLKIKDKQIFRLVDYSGKYKIKNRMSIDYNIEKDIPTQIIIELKKAIIIKKDKNNDETNYEKDKTDDNVYWVGKNKIKNYHDFHENYDEWLDIPLFDINEIIGKLTIDGWENNVIINNYDIMIISRYCKNAGQIIKNARTRRDILKRQKAEEAILEMNNKIANLKNRDILMYESVKLACKTMGTRDCSIFLYDESDKILKRSMSYALTDDGNEIKQFPDEKIIPGKLLTGFVFKESKYIFKNNINKLINRINKNDSVYSIKYKEFMKTVKQYEDNYNEKIYNGIFVPLFVDNQKIGLLRAINKLEVNDYNEKDFDENDLEMFKLLGGQIAIAISNNLLFEKERNASIKANEAINRFQILFDKIPDGVVLIDPNGKDGKWPIIECNDSFCKMNGYTREELTNQTKIKDINDLNVEHERKDDYLKRLENKDRLTIEAIHRKKDGTKFPIQASTCLVTLNNKKYVLGIDRDITELKNLNEITKLYSHQIVIGNYEKALENILKIVKERTNCDIITLYTYDEINKKLRHPPKYIGDLKYIDKIQSKKIVESNSIVYKMLYSKKPTIINDTDNDNNFKNINFKKREKIKSLIAIPLKIKKRRMGVMFINYRLKHKFSKEELKYIKLLADHASVSICNEQLLKEIETKKKALENSVDKQILRLYSILGNVINHEIGNSVGFIRVKINNILRNNKKLSKKVINELQEGRECAQNLLDSRDEISENMHKLLFEKPQKIQFNNLTKIFEDNKQIMADMIRNKIKYQIVGFDKMPSILMVASLLYEGIIFELVRNSIKAMPNGGNLSIIGYCKKEYNVIEIKDNGIGIKEEDKPKIFNMGYSNWSNGSNSGNGLSFLKMIVEFYRGNIKLKSKLRKGTTFIIKLPYR
jgi:PAS domain S-box-containing protein